MIPDHQTLMSPVLRQLLDGNEHQVKDMAAAMAVEFGLTSGQVVRDQHGARCKKRHERCADNLRYVSRQSLIEVLNPPLTEIARWLS